VRITPHPNSLQIRWRAMAKDLASLKVETTTAVVWGIRKAMVKRFEVRVEIFPTPAHHRVSALVMWLTSSTLMTVFQRKEVVLAAKRTVI